MSATGLNGRALQRTQFGLHRTRADQPALNEISLTNETGDKRRQWIVIQVVRRIPLLQPTLIEHPHLITDRKGLILVVGHQNRTGAAGLEDVAHFMAQASTQFAVEVGEGLVQQQQLRLRRQRAGQRHTLLLPTGKLMRETLAQVAEVHQP